MADIKLKAGDVYEAEGVEGIENGTPVIDISGNPYSIETVTPLMAMPDEERGFPRSAVLEAMKYLAGYEVKTVRKEERDAEVRAREEERLKAQETVIRPLFAEMADILTGFENIPAGILGKAHCRISFRKGTVSLDLESGIPADTLKGYEEELGGGGSLGFRFNPEAEEEANRWIPSIKAAGTRSSGTYVLQNGRYALIDGKGKGEGAGAEFRFLVRNGSIFVDSKYCNGTDFLLRYTVERGNEENPSRRFSQPSKRVLAVSRWERELTEEEAEGLSRAAEEAEEAGAEEAGAEDRGDS